MAERRMFHSSVIQNDDFLTMPLSSQALYFHLAMNADDEGFVGSPRSIQKTIGANDDDAKILIAKDFIKNFKSGVIVVSHWNIHNKIRSDRIKETVYLNEKNLLTLGKDNVYILSENNSKPETKKLPKKEKNMSAYVRLDYVRLDYIREILPLQTIYSLESNDKNLNKYLELWLEEKSFSKVTPSAYKSALILKINQNMASVIEEFVDWVIPKMRHDFIQECKDKILIVNNKEKRILGIEEKNNKVEVYFTDGSRGIVNDLLEFRKIIMRFNDFKGDETIEAEVA